MKLLVPLLLIALCWITIEAGLMVYAAGREAMRRECPPAQQGERLLRSEQRTNSTICTYASGWNGYGRKITQQHTSTTTKGAKRNELDRRVGRQRKQERTCETMD